MTNGDNTVCEYAAESSNFALISTYYRETDLDYRLIWQSGRNKARHFGFDYGGFTDHGKAINRAREKLADISGITNETRVVDCGCGLGGTSIFMAKNRGASVVGIDIVPSHVEHAANAAFSAGIGELAEFRCADFSNTRLAAGAYDTVLIQEALCHSGSKPGFYREAKRLLAPGGRLVVAEYMLNDRHFARHDIDRIDRWCRGWAMSGLWRTSEHVSAAREAGFSEIELTDFSAEAKGSLRRLYRYSRLCLPFAQLLYALGFRSTAANRNVEASILQYETFAEGIWIYGILRATL